MAQNSNIQIEENNKIISDPKKVGEIFNDFFINVASDIGTGETPSGPEHPSIKAIKENNKVPPNSFSFVQVDQSKVEKYLKDIGTKKATGIDNVSSKILNLTSTVMIGPITSLINSMIKNSTFPDTLKSARISPIFKKENPLERQNYRPVSILPAVSKVFERTISRQLDDYFSNIFHPFLSAYRSGYSCETVLLALTEEWRRALDRNHYVAAILMDLSKAFDCVPYDLLYDKLEAYGLDQNAVNLIKSYLTERKQCVRVGSTNSCLKNIKKGVPQGSILGPTIFNIFVNDIFHFVKKSDLVNYADDNTLTFTHSDINVLKKTLEDESNILIKWFKENKMRANPDKFQEIAIGKKSVAENLSFNIGGIT